MGGRITVTKGRMVKPFQSHTHQRNQILKYSSGQKATGVLNNKKLLAYLTVISRLKRFGCLHYFYILNEEKNMASQKVCFFRNACT